MLNRSEQEIMKKWNIEQLSPLVSICTITYNHEKFIEESINSFLRQETNFPFEIVIGEDCSSDNTKAIIQNYMLNYPNIIKLVSSSKNVGMQNNVRRTIQACKGKYIALCEGDDYWTDIKKLQIQKDFLDANKEYVLSFHDVVAFKDKTILPHYIGGAKRDLLQNDLKQMVALNTLTVMFRNVIIDFPVEFSLSKYGDLFLWTLLSKYGKGKYLKTIEPAMYRLHEGGAHSLVSDKKKYDNLLISYSCIFSYYDRLDDKEMKMYLRSKIIEMITRRDGFKYVFKYSAKSFASSIKHQVKNLFFKRRV